MVETGRFWCLYCEREGGYQLREWKRTRFGILWLVPWARHQHAKFVRCDACEATFDPECLDESSVESCAELMVSVPDFTWRPSRVPTWESRQLAPAGQTLGEFLGWEDAAADVTSE